MKLMARLLSVILTVPFIFQWGCKNRGSELNPDTVGYFTRNFENPPSEFRSAPLWDWNGDITREGIDFHMKEFKKAGIGGVFVHPRPGLLTEYLSDKWFELFDYTVQKGKELDMKVWIYDENSYPSGFAGGHVPAEMPDSYKNGAGLSLEIQEKLNVSLSDTLAVVLKKEERGFTDVTALVNQEMGKTGIYYLFRKTYPEKSPWYGGFTYVDLLYPGVTQKFLELTMTKGYEKSSAEFGKTLPGIFTDEPNLEAAMGKGSVMRWTPDLFEKFQKRWGYDLKVNLPSLVEETGNWKKVRHDYYELILEMFIDRWAKPWNEYCTQKKLNWTGHYWEHGWPEPTHGFDEAAFYLYHQMPGVDMLGNRYDTAGYGGQFGNDRAVRELRSAANQAGWKRTLSETYGGGGWEMTFETQKRLVDWECVMGVNFVNQHLSYYTLNGVRKFDYPPSFSYHEPWWENYSLMGDYIGRICMAGSVGKQVNKILVLQPNTTAWMYFSRKDKKQEVENIRQRFKNFVYRLEQLHVEYDLGSEYVVRNIGKVKGKILSVGKRDYSLIVIPAEMENLDYPTVELLKSYLKNGGKVLSFRKEIQMVDGENSTLVNDLSGKAGKNWIVAEKLENETVRDLLENDECSMNDISMNGMLYHQRRKLNDGELIFVVNSHPSGKANARIKMKGKYVAYYDLVHGKVYVYPFEKEKDKVVFQVDLQPAGSALFAVGNHKPDFPEYEQLAGTETIVQSSGEPVVNAESDNILMVNYLDLKTAKSDKKGIYFMNALIGLFNENGIEMGNPWQHKIQYRKKYLELDTLFTEKSWFEASYPFSVSQTITSEALKTIRAVVEQPQFWKVYINGNEIQQSEGKFWIDRSFPQFEIGRYLKAGKNTLTLKAPRMNILAEVMPVYVLGNFLVKPAKGGFEITEGKITSTGSWREAGLPFYSQKVAYNQDFKVSENDKCKFKVRLGKWNGSVAEVLVNGQKAGLISWQPYELDVTNFIKPGNNAIAVKITGSLKNTFGFFYKKNDNWIFGPSAWNYAPEKAPEASGYFLMDYGLMEPFELVKVTKN